MAPGSLALADAIERSVPPGLPPKFCVAIEGGGVLIGSTVDVEIELQAKQIA